MERKKIIPNTQTQIESIQLNNALIDCYDYFGDTNAAN